MERGATADRGAGPRPATRSREAIPERYRWDLGPIYPGWGAWEEGLARLRELIDEYALYRGTLDEGPDRLLATQRLNDELGQLLYRVYEYPALMACEDTRDNSVQARLEQARLAWTELEKASAWYTPELLEIGEERVAAWLEATPELAPYRFPIAEAFRRRRHVLDERGERLLALAVPLGGTPARTYTMLADADVDFPLVTLSTGEELVASAAGYARALRSCRQQADREAVFAAHLSVYDRLANTYASVYNAVLQRDWFVAQARGYATALEASLDQNDIPAAVVTGLIATAADGVEPLRRYHRLRRRVLGVERYHDFDAYVPLVETEWELPYDAVAPLVVESVALFGEAYQETVRRAFAERWIDVYENRGKRSGAFSAGVYGVHPYMLLNYADTLDDAFTVAHEMGHTMHTVLSHSSQPFATADYTIFVAEVASMTNESLFLDRLLAGETDERRRVVLLQHAIDAIAGSFYRQAMFAAYELEAHRAVERGEPITAERLQQVYLEALARFQGPVLDDVERVRNTWARIPHFFASPYYVYQYATSKAAAALLVERMTTGDRAGREAAIARYLELLAAGGNDHPTEQLRRAGIDLTTSGPTEALVARLDRLVGELEAALA